MTLVCHCCFKEGPAIEFYRVWYGGDLPEPSGFYCPACGSADLEEKQVSPV
jgi:hypothetical protein